MAKKPTKKRPPCPSPSISSSSSAEESPSPSKKFSAGSTAAVLRKPSQPSLDHAGSKREEDQESSDGKEAVESKDGESSGDRRNADANCDANCSHPEARRVLQNADNASDLKLKKSLAATETLAATASTADKTNEVGSSDSEEEEFMEDELSENSENAARQAGSPTQLRDYETAKNGGLEASDTASSSDSDSEDGVDGEEVNSSSESKQIRPISPSRPARNLLNPIADKLRNSLKSFDEEEEGDGSFESEEEESSEDYRNATSKEILPPQPHDSQNADDCKQSSNTSSTSGSGLGKEDAEAPMSDPSLKPHSNKPFASSDQPVQKEPSSVKPSATSLTIVSRKKLRATGVAVVEVGQEKVRFQRIWSNEDELALLQGILEFKEQNQIIPFNHIHVESLLNTVKDSLSISVSANQLIDKVRRMKKRYTNTIFRINRSKRSKISDPHNAAVFILSKKIWDSYEDDNMLIDNKIKPVKKMNFDKNRRESKHFAEEYPSLNWCLKSEHTKIAPVVQIHMPMEAAKDLEKKCRKLEMMDISLNAQKLECLSSAVKLIQDALAKC